MRRDAGQPLVEGRPGQVRGGGAGRLVAALLQVRPQGAEQLLAGVPGVVRQQRAEFALDERLQPGLVAQQVQQAGQPDVRQPEDRQVPAVPAGRLGDLPRLDQRPACLPQAAHPGPGRDDHRTGRRRPGPARRRPSRRRPPARRRRRSALDRSARPGAAAGVEAYPTQRAANAASARPRRPGPAAPAARPPPGRRRRWSARSAWPRAGPGRPPRRGRAAGPGRPPGRRVRSGGRPSSSAAVRGPPRRPGAGVPAPRRAPWPAAPPRPPGGSGRAGR